MPEIDLCGNKSVVQLRDVYHAECIRKVLAAAQAQHEVYGGLLLDVVVSERAPVFELLACKDQALLVRRDALLHTHIHARQR